MSNRLKNGGNRPVRPALLHALDVEYARASKARNVARMAEISEIVQRLEGIFQDVPQAAPEAPPVPQPIPLAVESPAIAPALYTPSGPLQDRGSGQATTTNLKLTSLQDILIRAEEGPPIAVPPIRVPEAPQGWRQRAKTAVLAAVSAHNTKLANDRPLYEQALMARNHAIEPLAGLKLAASIQGISVEEKIEQTIAEYDAGSRRTMYVDAVQQRAMKAIDAATTGDEADAIAKQAVADIKGDDE